MSMSNMKFILIITTIGLIAFYIFWFLIDIPFKLNIDKLLEIKSVEIQFYLKPEKMQIAEKDVSLVKDLLTKIYKAPIDGIPRDDRYKEWIDINFYLKRNYPLTPYHVSLGISYNTNIIAIDVNSDEVISGHRAMIDIEEIREEVDYLISRYRND